ncbi:hypothetical protein PV04_00186 [Phialophora macrospora]|uniref:Bacteriocin-protection protein, YdeI/OmpD-associated family n=1 Tax=Phialophora macrospora TaxID=1851006 RepID=A0A0D2FZQ7_9EURO|nr:hypothetical protein PV04_00186 [Phialophora macrospora]
MPLKQLPLDLPIHTFSSAKDFEAFLDREHLTAPGCYIKLAKKASGIPSISAPEAVEVCLCFGWIDGGGGGSIDEKWWLMRYTPRRTKSMWSKKNTDTVGRLIQEGKMRPAGMAAVEAAKTDGRWERAYDGPATITVPDDLAAALKATPTASVFFNSLNKSHRYAVLHRVQTASLKSRATRIEALVQMLAVGKVPGKVGEPQAASGKDGVRKKSRESKKTTAQVKAKSTKKTAARQVSGARDMSSKVLNSRPAGEEPRRPGLRPRN